LDFSHQKGIADPIGETLDFVESDDAGERVREPDKVRNPEHNLTVCPFVALDIFEEGGGGAEPLGGREPGVCPLCPVASLHQPMPGPRIAGLLEVNGY